MKLLNNKITKSLLAVSVGTLAVATGANAADVNTVTSNMLTQLTGVNDLISAVAYVAGIGFGIKAALKFKEHNETKGQVPLSQPITLAIVAGLLIALPTFLSVAKGGVFGSGSQANTLSGQATRTIN